jgi:hypothetical protein
MSISIVKYITENFISSKTGKINASAIRKIDKYSFEYIEILRLTNFTDTESISERIYLILNNYKTSHKCKSCNIEETKFISFIQGYRTYCSNKECCFTVQGDIEKFKKTIYNKYTTDKNSFYDGYLKYNDNTSVDVIKQFIKDRSIVTNNGIKNQWVNKKIYREHKDVLYGILKCTKDIITIEKDNYKWSERFYIIQNSISEIPLCGCDKIARYKNYIDGYSLQCSVCNTTFSKNRIINHYNNTIKPNIETQGFVIKNEYELLENGINAQGTILECSVCKITHTYDVSDGKSNFVKCKSCFPNVSKEELSLQYYLESIYAGEIIPQYNFSGSKKYDFYIPEHKLAIEYNGIYYHSSGNDSINTDKTYHSERNNISENNGISCIHIFSHQWQHPETQHKWKSILKNKLSCNNSRIYARKCNIVELSSIDSNTFLDTNHFQKNCNSKIRYGLEYNNDIVSVMTFSKPRFNKNYEWELIRFCSKIGYSVVGGASKLLKHFEKINNPKNLISYSDRSRGIGNVYNILGFEFIKNTEENYVYYKGNQLLSRYKCQKAKLESLLEEFDINKTEKENMFNNGYRILYDCGNKLFLKNYKLITI